MASSNTEICNLAISHLGVGKEIADVETENSAEAKACRRFYDTALRATLGDFAWPFATKLTTLALVEEDPTEEWGFSYRYPTDCLQLRRIPSGIRNDNRQSRVPYRVGRDDDGLLIYTDTEDAEIEYTAMETDTQRYPADFVLALSARLAAYVAPRLTGGDPFKLGLQAMKMYMMAIATAQANRANEEQSEEVPESEFVRARY